MPIRFRCAYCNQLMGIARRKAGAVVSCPKCNGQVVVPSPEDEPAAASPPFSRSGPLGGGLFEVSNFGQELAPGHREAAHFSPQAEPLAWNNPIAVEAGDEFDVVPITANANRPRGLVLSPLVLAILGVLVLVLVGLGFVLGLLIGQSSG